MDEKKQLFVILIACAILVILIFILVNSKSDQQFSTTNKLLKQSKILKNQSQSATQQLKTCNENKQTVQASKIRQSQKNDQLKGQAEATSQTLEQRIDTLVNKNQQFYFDIGPGTLRFMANTVKNQNIIPKCADISSAQVEFNQCQLPQLTNAIESLSKDFPKFAQFYVGVCNDQNGEIDKKIEIYAKFQKSTFDLVSLDTVTLSDPNPLKHLIERQQLFNKLTS